MKPIRYVAILLTIIICCSLPAVSWICGNFPSSGRVCTGTTGFSALRPTVSDPIELNQTAEMRNIIIDIGNEADRILKNVTLIEIFPSNVSLVDSAFQGSTEKPKLIRMENNSNGTTKLIELALGSLNISENKILNLTIEYKKSGIFNFDENEIKINAEPRPLPKPP